MFGLAQHIMRLERSLRMVQTTKTDVPTPDTDETHMTAYLEMRAHHADILEEAVVRFIATQHNTIAEAQRAVPRNPPGATWQFVSDDSASRDDDDDDRPSSDEDDDDAPTIPTTATASPAQRRGGPIRRGRMHKQRERVDMSGMMIK